MAQRIIAIYGGRFQPFHKGHNSVYQLLVKKFGRDNVYIATSDKTNSEKSPFNFDEKQLIMTKMFGIPKDRVVNVQSPYKPTEILKKYDPKNTSFVTAVSEKDAERLGSRGVNAYYSKLDSDALDSTPNLKGYGEQGYYIVVPEFKLDVRGHNISGSTIRKALSDPTRPTSDRRKLFKMLYGKVDNFVFGLITKKLTQPKSIESPSTQHAVVPPTARVKNPITKRDILVKTALKYPPDHPSHVAAVNYIKSLTHESILHIKPIWHLEELIHKISYEDVINTILLEAILQDDRKTICLINEAKSSTERVRKYYRKHPKKVRSYLKKTQSDRVARNKDRRKAVKKYGKSKMNNHDVHHPNGAKNGHWRLAKKDHGRDKLHEDLLTDIKEFESVSDGAFLLTCGGAAGHMMHPFDDPTLTFADLKNMIQMALIGRLDSEAPVTEKLDGQNIAFTVKNGEVRFARNKGHTKKAGESSLTADELRKKFSGRGDIEHTFGEAAEDLQQAISALSPDELEKIFKEGSRFASVEVINPSSENIIPYNKTVLIIHNVTEYDDDGQELGRSMEAGKYLSDKITEAEADTQKKYGIKGPSIITMNDYDVETFKEKAELYQRTIDHFKDRYRLKDKNTVADYLTRWWGDEIDNMARKTGVKLAPYKKGLIQRWAFGKKDLQLTKITDPKVRKLIKDFEPRTLAREQERARKPFERTFLKVGSDALSRTTNLLAANNPLAGKAIKEKVAEVLRQLRKTDSADQVEFLDRQIRRLGAIGFDKVVPTEGIVFTYNGKPYKFTGTFAPINQLIGTMKFGRTSEPDQPEDSNQSDDKTQSPETDRQRQLIEPFLHQRIRNPKTGNDIYVGSALGYKTRDPVLYQTAVQYIQQRMKGAA
jgi:hypothetical protein